MAKIAVIGGGIVGATTAFFLSQATNNKITVFDQSRGQATSASAGIISPWLSKRRNQKWYRLANAGASLYPQLVQAARLDQGAYQEVGTIITRKTNQSQDELWQLAQTRQQTAPQMKHIEQLSANQINERLPFLELNQATTGVFVSGGARVDGHQLVKQLLARAHVNLISKKATLSQTSSQVLVNKQSFDQIVIAAGAGVTDLISELKLNLQVRPQKGQLIELVDDQLNLTGDMPVLMPEGERDFIPTGSHQLIIGATHENERGFDLKPSKVVIDDLLRSGQSLIPSLTETMITRVRVGTRAYTNDFAPFFGQLKPFKNIWIGSGLGSSGLTTGPAIGKMLAQAISGQQVNFASFSLPVEHYLASSARNA